MREWLDRLEQFAVDVILERRYGKRAFLLRALLWHLSALYAIAVRLRLWLYHERFLQSTPVGCLVISVGNLTVGGTGKTPVVEKIARALASGGRQVAVLSRGYKSKPPPLLERLRFRWLHPDRPMPPRIVSDGRSLLLDSARAGDEPFMLGANLKGIPVLVNKDRVQSALYAIRRWGVDTLVLDDGFQYLPLGQRVDVVLIDSQAPFGNEYLLPRGTLREPPDHLKRADIIFLTKCDQSGNEPLKQRIRRFNRHAEIVECRHVPRHLQDIFTDERFPLEFLNERRITALSGIAVPDSFEAFLRSLGAEIVYSRQFADHHRYSAEEMLAILKRSRTLRSKAIITTEKDAVRLPILDPAEVSIPIYFMRVEIDILSGHESFEQCLARICHQPANPALETC